MIPPLNHFIKHFFLFTFFLFAFTSNAQLERVKRFGSNKGHLKMYVHVPPGLDKSKAAPMVVVLHGCLQCAGSVASQTGWNKLADQYGFYVLYPQQRATNNMQKCFKWYKRKHLKKGKGENASIMSMVDHMKSIYKIDSSKVYITGLSAGAAMSVIMMADYPETFNSGAIFAGGPYKVANGMIQGVMSLVGWRLKSPEKWADLVRRQNTFYKGEYPRMIIYQGNKDRVVNKRNGVELMEQWTSLHGISTKPTETIPRFLDNADIERNAYQSSGGKEAVIFYKVNGLGHALIVDPGRCTYEGGRRGFFSKDKDYFSTLWTAYDFDLIQMPLISGKDLVKPDEKGLMYVVAANPDANYEWKLPEGCRITGDKTNNAVFIDWGNNSGCINVTEIDGKGCKKQYKSLFVRVESR